MIGRSWGALAMPNSDRPVLHEYQEAAVDFLYGVDEGLVLSPLGSGKTAIALRYIYEMIRDGHARRYIVVAPLKVCQTVWRQEAAKWRLPLKVQLIEGPPAKRKRVLEEGDFDVALINYEQLIWFCREFRRQKIFDGIIFDELTKLKAPGSQRFRLMRNHITAYKYRIGMTATLAAEGVPTLYAQMYMIDKGRRLGRTKEAFEAEFMLRTGPKPWQVKPRRDAVRRIADLVGNMAFSLSSGYNPPELIEVPVYLELPDDVRQLYNDLERDLYAQIQDAEIMTPNAGALRTKLRQVATGQVYTNPDRRVAPLHTVKEEWLTENRDQIAGNVLVAYWFKFEPTGPVLDADLIDEWNSGRVPEMWVHPASAGHGLNLQGGGSALVFKTLPESRDMYDQTIGRLRRQGQKASTVFVYIPLVMGTVEEDIWKALRDKHNVDRAVLAGVKDRQRSLIPDSK